MQHVSSAVQDNGRANALCTECTVLYVLYSRLQSFSRRNDLAGKHLEEQSKPGDWERPEHSRG